MERIISEMQPTIVQIVCEGSDQATPLVGTGFFVNDSAYLLTAAHVVNPPPPASCRLLYDQMGIPDEADENGTLIHLSQGTPVMVVDLDAIHDVALLKMEKNPFRGELIPLAGIARPNDKVQMVEAVPKVARLGYSEVPLGRSVAVSGYPLFSSPLMLTQSGLVAGIDYLTNDVNGVPVKGLPIEWLAIDVSAHPGNSGGPVYETQTGAVIGICRSRWFLPATWGSNGQPVTIAKDKTDDSVLVQAGVTMVIPIKYAIELLNKDKVSYTAAWGGRDK
jgi:S1-C subfamily serine protease